MNILSVHNRYLQRGGEDESSESETELLRANGHNVVEYIHDNHTLTGKAMYKVGLRSIWNQETYRQIIGAVQQHRIDLVKVDNFFPQVSPAVYYAARAAGVPAVQTLRNFRIGCPGATLFRNGAVCEECIGKSFAWPGIVHGCYRNSRLVTAAPALMAALHRVAGTWNQRVSAYIALTEFSRRKFVEIGLPEEKIFVKPNSVADHGLGSGEGGYALFAGRLSAEKGIGTLLAAWQLLGSSIPLKIVGSGPLAAEVAAAAAANRAIEVLGTLPLSRVYELMGNAAMVVFPSEGYETFGRIVAESFSKGTPVLAARIGFMPSMISHRESGLLFHPGNAESPAAEVRWMLANRDRWPAMRAAARAAYQQHYTPGRNYERMIEIYNRAIANHRAAARGRANAS